MSAQLTAVAWPHTAADLPNHTQVWCSVFGLYHNPRARCDQRHGRQLRLVPLVSALVYGSPCNCWNAGAAARHPAEVKP